MRKVDDRIMTAPSFNPRALLTKSQIGVLATIKADGRPQLSPVQPFYDESAGVILVSTSAGTAKVANLRWDARATLEVTARTACRGPPPRGSPRSPGRAPTPTGPRWRRW
ncbi:hypothetical protein GCM10009601_49180 [Streptomyces thermospinosisporus]|uniref:Pyridoxamine 5'-phosphate oxidase N-terminal domain-containing protein n=1 Tax=Streptomyces thermospinosisporus TaxID=161482 RepID=A0ABN1Z457_9ACTN